MDTIRTRVTRWALGWLALLSIFSSWGITFAAQDFPDVAASAFRWVEGQQQPDGSFPGFGAGSTVDAVLAFIAMGADPNAYSQGGNTPVTFLESKAAEIAMTPGGAGKLLIAVAAMGTEDPTSFGGINLISTLNTAYDPASGQYGKDAIGHAFAMLGLHAANQPIPAEAVARLKALQTPEGGWAFSGETAPGAADTNTTAVAVQALVVAGVDPTDPALAKASAYLKSQQNADGGFPYQQGGEFGSDSDVNSSAYVSQAFTELREGHLEIASATKSYIRSMQSPSGAFKWKADEPDDNPGATYQAIPALIDVTLATPYDKRLVNTPPPGMPTTGVADLLPVAALLALGSLALVLGLGMRRGPSAR
jgi:hypothetical protein